jgi:RNase H-fold protein (predicted Holliday junction resolvase)
VKLADERLTSWEAAQIVAQHKSPSSRKKSSIDNVAAAVLLREYLDRNRAHAQHVAAERE